MYCCLTLKALQFGRRVETLEILWNCCPAGPVAPGHKPVLVFINTKSGPQQGVALRRKFLRLLNPLQARAAA